MWLNLDYYAKLKTNELVLINRTEVGKIGMRFKEVKFIYFDGVVSFSFVLVATFWHDYQKGAFFWWYAKTFMIVMIRITLTFEILNFMVIYFSSFSK